MRESWQCSQLGSGKLSTDTSCWHQQQWMNWKGNFWRCCCQEEEAIRQNKPLGKSHCRRPKNNCGCFHIWRLIGVLLMISLWVFVFIDCLEVAWLVLCGLGGLVLKYLLKAQKAAAGTELSFLWRSSACACSKGSPHHQCRSHCPANPSTWTNLGSGGQKVIAASFPSEDYQAAWLWVQV